MSKMLEKMPETTVRRFKPYPKYKDLGAEWLGKVPAEWSVRRADHFLRYDKIQVDPEIFKSDIVFHYSIPSIQETGDGAYENATEIDSAKLLLKGRRLLISKLNPRKGVVLIAQEHDVPTVCSSEFISLDPKDCDLGFSFYLYASYTTRERLSAVVQSATRSHQRANPEDITKMWHALPTPKEQRTISDFLDRETAKIDALVAKKGQLVELLQEKRSALITRTVTKGLDMNVPMKDSDVESLGRIPRQFVVIPFKRIAFYQEGPGIMAEDFMDEGVPLIRIGNLTPGTVNLEGCNYLSPEKVERKWKHFRLADGDLLISGSATMGVVSIVDKESAGAVAYTGIMRLRPAQKNIVREYIKYFVVSGTFIDQINALKTGVGIQHYGPTHLSRVVAVLPPTDEQRSIAAFLDLETRKIDTLIDKILDGIECLKEYRTALISAAVTGKIDVREAA